MRIRNMAPTQFYITGLFNGVTTEELQSILNPYGTVQNIDIKIKTNTQGDDFRTFAIVDIDADEKNLTKCFSNYNNTLWKGKRMKLSKTKATILNKSEIINPANEDYSSTRQKKLTSEEHKIFSPNEVPMSDKRLSMFSKYKDHKYQAMSCNIDNDENETSNPEEIDDLGPVCEGVPMFKGISAMQSVLHKNADISTSFFDGRVERHLRKAQIVADNNSKTLGFQTSTPKSPEKVHFNNVKVNYSKEHSVNKMHHSNFQSHSHKENSVLSRLEGFSSIWRDGEENENGVIDFDVDDHCNQLADVDYHSDSSTNSDSRSKKCNKDVSTQPVNEFLKIRKKASDFFDKNYSSNHASEKVEENKRDDRKSKKERPEIKKAIPNKNALPFDYVSQQDVLKVKQVSKEKKIKTKSVEMKLQDNEKRMRSIKEKQSELKSKQKVIQHALASVDSNQTSNKKIFFDSEDENEDVSGKINQNFSREKSFMEASPENHTDSTSQKKPQLFDEDDDEFFPENLDAVFKDKKQFEGTSGRKLLELQSAFGADERFKLDERFMNNTGDFEDEDMSEKDNDNNSVEEFTEETDLKQENLRSLDILRNVIDLSSSMVEDHKKKKKQKIPEMIRYDERNPEHSVYIAPEKKIPLISLEPPEKNETSIPVVSQECFFEVDPSLESALQTDKANKKESFSLLNVFSSMRNDDEDKNFLKEQIYTPKTIKTKIKNPLVYDSSDAEEESENLNKKAKGLPKTEMISGLTNQTFFFFPNDLRLQDGIKFFTRKEELHVDYKNWIEIRETLKQNIKIQAKNTTKDRWKKRRRFQTNTFKDRKK